jgi:hypothetical protein
LILFLFLSFVFTVSFDFVLKGRGFSHAPPKAKVTRALAPEGSAAHTLG